MTWQIYIGICIVTYSLAVLVQRLILRSMTTSPIAFSIVSQLVCALILGLVGVAFGQLTWTTDLSSVFWNLGFMTLAYGLGSVVTTLALKTSEASKFTVLFATRAFLSIAIAGVMLGEKLTNWQLMGALLIFVGVVITSWQAKKFVLEKADWLTLFGALCFGAANVNDRFILQQMPLITYNFLAFLLPPLAVAAVFPSQVKLIPTMFTKIMLLKIGLLSSLYCFSALTFFSALKIAPNTSQVVSINLISVILIVVLSVILLKERSKLWLKLIGAGVCFAGLMLVS